ncbi:MAG: NUDIX domain-containing protein [Caldilineaceae bacterium]
MKQYQQHAHCSYCGQPFAVNQPWPRRCAHCNHTTFRNPLPVTVVIQPVDEGVLTIRRTIQPRSGWLALPGGYIEFGETWQAAGAREVWEEAGLQIDPATLREVRVFSAPDNTLIIVALAPRLASDQLADFITSTEANERVIVTAPQELAFPLHTEVLTDYLAGKWR